MPDDLQVPVDLAHYIFLPFLRRGMAQYIEIEDKPDDTAHNIPSQRTGIMVSLPVDQKPSEDITQLVQFYGPGDVIGLDRRIIVRTDPTYRAVVSDYEPNFMPMVELSRGDLPWCMTPAIAPTGHSDRLRPWICLVVLKVPDGEDVESEYEELDPTSDSSLPAIEVKLQNGELPLPDLDQSWAWVHVQVTTEKNQLPPDQFLDILVNSPHLVTSRLTCPRKLEEGVLYHAFIVPTYETGRCGGIGDEIPAGTGLLDPAWDVNDENPSNKILPYYFKWEFRTGLRGDFEYLVRLLEPRVIDKRVGIRHINCRFPRYDFTDIVSVDELTEDDELKHSLGLEGALRSLQTESTKWPTSTDDPFQSELMYLLNLPSNFPDMGVPEPHDNPLIVPPLYGAWHESRKQVIATVPDSDNVNNRDWFNELNLDLRHRMTAGFGTLVIQDQQEQLMASAWEQVGTVIEANQRLRQGQLAMEVQEKLQVGQLQQLSLSSYITLTSKLHSRVLIDTVVGGSPTRVTLSHLVKNNSQIPPSILTPTFRRIQRSRGPLACSQKLDENPNRKSLLERLNIGEVTPAGEPPEPDGTIKVGGISETLRPPLAWIIELFGSKMKRILLFIFTILSIILVGLIIVYRALSDSSGFEIILPYILVALVIVIVVLRFLLPLYFNTVLSGQINASYITADTLRSISIPPGTQFETPPFELPSDPPIANLDPNQFLDYAIHAHEAFLDRGLETITPYEPLDLINIQTVLLNTLNPRNTIFNRTRLQFRFSDRIDPELNPIRIGPEFPQPMYESLRDLSHEYLLPGLEFIPQNTIGLLEINRKFIESYMVGINAEMARELLWREYPSPLDATYFKQFWDVNEYVPAQVIVDEINEELAERDDFAELTAHEIEVEFDKLLKAKLRDISDIHRWRKWDPDQNKWVPAKLGQNPLTPEGQIPTTTDEEEERKLVLLIRGDLLKKYPTALIYAVEGKWVEAQAGETYICTFGGNHYRRDPDFSFTEDKMKTPIFRGTLPPEITFLGFDLVEDLARGNTEIVTADLTAQENNPGWYFVIEERVGETRFGIDEPLNDQVEDIEDWNDLNWGHISRSDLGYITGIIPECDTPSDPQWDSNSAERANILLQKPIRIAIHADDMIPKED